MRNWTIFKSLRVKRLCFGLHCSFSTSYMAQTLAQITKQIEKLQKEADALRQAELKGVVDRIKVAISHYGLTADQLGFGKPALKRAVAAKASAKSGGNVAGPRFANDKGQVWSGRGPRPLWLREALANGRSLEEFSTGPQKRSSSLAATPVQANAVAGVAPQVKTQAPRRGTKVSAEKAAAAKPAQPAGNGTSANVGVPKAKRQAKGNAAKPTRVKKASTNKASSVTVKSAPQPKAKRLKPISAAVKAAAASNDVNSGAAAPMPAGT